MPKGNPYYGLFIWLVISARYRDICLDFYTCLWVCVVRLFLRLIVRFNVVIDWKRKTYVCMSSNTVIGSPVQCIIHSNKHYMLLTL